MKILQEDVGKSYENFILVPIDGKIGKIHAGHKELINYAKELGTVVVSVTPSLISWYNHVLKGHVFEDAPEPAAELSSIQELGVDVFVMKREIFDEQNRLKYLKKAEKMVDELEQDLFIDSYKNALIVGLVGGLSREDKKLNLLKIDSVVRGPEVLSFFFKYFANKLNWPKNVIMPSITKHSTYKIKHQSLLDLLSSEAKIYVKQFSSILDSVQSQLELGNNSKIVEELNYSYQNENWSVRDIAVWEGGIVDGRIEVMRFLVRSGEATLIIEDTRYYK